MLEAEVKLALLPERVDALRERLVALGARREGERLQVDTYFAHPERDFRTTDEALRLRDDDGALRVTYKGPKLDPPRKTREEIEFGLAADHATACTLLERLGFRRAAEVRKRRSEWTLEDGKGGDDGDGAVVTIDQVEGLGLFCEIEVQAEAVEASRLRLQALQEELGLADLAPIPESYLELLERRRAKPR
jgi:adenylate cyclase class 2